MGTPSQTQNTQKIKRQPQIVQVIIGKPVDHLREIIRQVRPEIELAIHETTDNMEHFYIGSIVISSGNPSIFMDFTRQKRVTFDMRGLNQQSHIPVNPPPSSVEESIRESLECCERWLSLILKRLKEEPDICSMELVLMFRREVGEKSGRLYARKETLNAKR